MRIAIGIPSGDTFKADFGCALATLTAYTNKADVDLAIVNKKGPDIARNRNDIVASARRLDADYLLFMDTDMTFPPDTLLHLIAARREVIACDARRKRSPHSTIAIRHGGLLGKTNKIIEVDSIGTGIMLIHMSIFREMPKPYFLATDEVSEDIYFCKRARLAGHAVYCHGPLSQKIGHIGDKEFRIE